MEGMIPKVMGTGHDIYISSDESSLLNYMIQDSNKRVRHIKSLGGESISCSGFTVDDSQDDFPHWLRILEGLERFGFIKAVGGKREVFTVTDRGFQLHKAIYSTNLDFSKKLSEGEEPDEAPHKIIGRVMSEGRRVGWVRKSFYTVPSVNGIRFAQDDAEPIEIYLD